MSIRIKRYVEPLSLASRRPGTPVVIIESDAYRQVAADLEKYLDGEILGRSFLVAGHRGAGKTTMLRHAVQEVETRIRARGEGSKQFARPLFVALHGPDLVEKPQTANQKDDGRQKDAQEKDADKNVEGKNPKRSGEQVVEGPPRQSGEQQAKQQAQSTAPPDPPPADELFRFLDRITSGLYFAASQEFSQRFRDQADSSARSERERSELLELAADLQVQLDKQPDLDRLRDYWARVNAIDGGVLFEPVKDAGRGVEEVTALFSIGRAMQTFTGTRTASLVTQNRRSRKFTASLVTIDGQNLFVPLLGLATGALVWNATPPPAEGSDALLKAATAMLTGFGTVLALKINASRGRSSQQTWKETFIPKDDPGSLYRVLPVLIERFQRVGLYPVFVVDELDKVPGLGLKINALLGYMKQFVTERAFFCFVTNRSFYQQANVQAEESAYSTLHTRFGDSVFVRYKPEDFHTYLDGMISVDGMGLSPEDLTKANDAAGLLRYLLLGRSYLHPYDLRRELSQWQDQTSVWARTVNDLNNVPRLHREVAAQVAVEVVYASKELAEHVRDPITAQTVLDALYYPFREWRAGANEFELTKKALRDHLVERTGIEEEVKAEEQEELADKLIPPRVQTVLLERVERLMALLCDPKLLVDEALTSGVKLPDAVIRMLQTLDAIVEKT